MTGEGPSRPTVTPFLAVWGVYYLVAYWGGLGPGLGN